MTLIECVHYGDTLVTVVQYVAIAAVCCSGFRYIFGTKR